MVPQEVEAIHSIIYRCKIFLQVGGSRTVINRPISHLDILNAVKVQFRKPRRTRPLIHTYPDQILGEIDR